MSFIGAIPSAVRKAVASMAPRVRGPVFLACAGNFTMAAALRAGGYTGEIKACDVSVYSSALGAALSGRDPGMRERDDCPPHLRGLLRLESPIHAAASIALLYDLRDAWQMKNPYQERMVEQYRRGWDSMMEKAVAKLSAFRDALAPVEYHPQDGFGFLRRADKNAAAVVFPPTYKRGYERLEKLLRAVVEWDQPAYQDMTDESLDLYRLVAEFDQYIVVLEKDLPDVHAIIGKPSVVLPRGRSAFSHIVVRLPCARPVLVRQKVKSAPAGPYLSPRARISGDEEISVSRLTLAQSLRMNELFLSTRIDYFTGGVGLSLAFRLNGRVFGKADFAPTTYHWKLPDDRPMIYLMCDLAVPSTEPRLAKLVLYALLSREIQDALREKYIQEFAWVCTTAFSRHPASMKYRGVFKLHRRQETENGYLLNYFAPFSGLSLKESLAAWRKKYRKNK